MIEMNVDMQSLLLVKYVQRAWTKRVRVCWEHASEAWMKRVARNERVRECFQDKCERSVSEANARANEARSAEWALNV